MYVSDSTPLVIFVAANEGISLLELEGSHTNYSSAIQTSTNVRKLRTLYSRDETVFKDNGGIKISKYVHSLVCG